MTTVQPGMTFSYGGSTPTDLDPWLWCDGSSESSDTLPDLYAAIASSYGADDTGDDYLFYLPDYRGVFLRGVDEGAGVDPDADDRTVSNPSAPIQGNSGDKVGSRQADALESHRHDWTRYTASVATNEDKASGHVNCLLSVDNPSSTTGASGGSETRPRNIYVNHLVCSTATDAGKLPIGTIIPCGFDTSDDGDLLAAGWIPCDGRSLAASDYPDLFGVIGQANGGRASASFCVPDLQGVFLRGVDGEAGFDPDAADRDAPRSTLANDGNTGDSVGSYQNDRNVSHNHEYEFEHEKAKMLGGTDKRFASYATDRVQTKNSQGTQETRPVNTNVNFLISHADGSALDSFDLPTGTILAYAGLDPTTLDDGWMVCDGRLLEVSDYEALSAAIGRNYGGSGSKGTFNLPDLRGTFVRGVANGAARAPGADDRTAAASGGNTGDAVGSVQASGFDDHEHSYDVPRTRHKGDGSSGKFFVLLKNDGSAGTSSTKRQTGGASETRPVNISVYWVIKVD